MIQLYYRMDGTPYTGTREEQTLAWAKDFENRETNGGIIKQETLPNGIYVSTVWLGLDHGFSEDRPLIFETMAFKGKGKMRKGIAQDRYTTIEEARAGHEAMVKKYSRKSK